MPEHKEIAVGSIAPDFILRATNGGTVSLSSLRPSRTVVYFYPRDDTSGCTNQALAFSKELDAFKAAKCEVIGISKDTLASHEKFARKHDLTITLASDADGDVCESFGVWVEKQMYGRKFMGIERSTFLIGPDGTIEKIWRKVRVPGHVDVVLQAVQSV